MRFLTITSFQSASLTHDLFRTDRDQFDSFACNKIQCLIYICDLMETHFAAIRLRQRLAGNHLQQQHQLKSITKIFFDVLDLGTGLSQMRIAPGSEGLFVAIESV